MRKDGFMKQVKKRLTYETAEIDVVKLSMSDVIATSSIGSGKDDEGWTGGRPSSWGN